MESRLLFWNKWPVLDLTRHLYRFVEKRWLEAFFDSGSVRLNTTYALRDTLAYTGSRGDESEARVRHMRVVDDLVLDGSRPEPVIDSLISGARAVQLKDCVFETEVRAPDRFVLSMTDRFSADMLRRFRDDCGADACFEITHGYFFKEISEAASNWANWFGCFPVTYIGDVVLYPSPDLDLPADIVKRARFSWQHEVRAMWDVKAPLPLHPQNMSVPSARRYARPVACLDGDAVRML